MVLPVKKLRNHKVTTLRKCYAQVYNIPIYNVTLYNISYNTVTKSDTIVTMLRSRLLKHYTLFLKSTAAQFTTNICVSSPSHLSPPQLEEILWSFTTVTRKTNYPHPVHKFSGTCPWKYRQHGKNWNYIFPVDLFAL